MGVVVVIGADGVTIEQVVVVVYMLEDDVAAAAVEAVRCTADKLTRVACTVCTLTTGSSSGIGMVLRSKSLLVDNGHVTTPTDR